MSLPWPLLSPLELGRRLAVVVRDEVADLEGVTVRADQETGQRWWVRRYAAPGQVHAEVAAGWLYRAAGVTASEWRLVELRGGELAAAQTARRWWLPLEAVGLVAGDAPIDAWVDNHQVLEGSRRRRHVIAGLASTVRLDLSGCLGWQRMGARARTSERLEVGPWGPLHQAALDRLARVTDGQIVEALEAARTPASQARGLLELLTERRDQVLVAGGRVISRSRAG